MPGTIGTHRLACGKEVEVLSCNDGTVFVLVDSDGTDPFGGRILPQRVAVGTLGKASPPLREDTATKGANDDKRILVEPEGA